jgi:hypothetical protein
MGPSISFDPAEAATWEGAEAAPAGLLPVRRRPDSKSKKKGE